MTFRLLCNCLIFVFVAVFFTNAFGQQLDIESLKKLQEKALQEKDHGKSAYYAYELSKLYLDQNNIEQAIDYLEQTTSYGKKVDDYTLEFLGHQTLGLVYSNLKNFNKAVDSYEDAVEAAKDLKNKAYTTEALILTGESYGNLQKWKKAIAPVEEALSIALRQNELQAQQKCYVLLAHYYEQVGDKDKIREYQNLYKNLAESKQSEIQKELQLKALEAKIENVGAENNTAYAKLKQSSKKLRLAEDSLLNTRYSLEATATSLKEAEEVNEKKEMEIALLSKNKQLAELKIKEQEARLTYETWIRNSVIGGLFIAAAFIGVVVRNNRQALEASKKIEKQNQSIKSSINYAKRIQEAMLPKDEQLKELIPESFVLFKPRDSVSGDFYWLTEIKNWYNPDVVFAAADCTGHGVPGAFMSMVGINALNNIIERGIAESDQILEALDTEIRNTLQQEASGNNDGMDISLGIFRKEKNVLEFSGAKNPLVYIQNNELFQVKGDVRSIGGRKSKNKTTFKKHNILIEEPTVFYLFSDGYRDQFGDKDKGKFLSKRFNQLLLEIHQLPMNEQKDILETTLNEWRGETHQIDDVLVMGIKLEPSF